MQTKGTQTSVGLAQLLVRLCACDVSARNPAGPVLGSDVFSASLAGTDAIFLSLSVSATMLPGQARWASGQPGGATMLLGGLCP